MLRQRHIIWPTILMLLSYAIVACSPEGRRKILTTLFDGVPEKKTEIEELITIDSSSTIDSIVIAAASPKPVKLDMYFHEPFVNKSCHDCHDQNRMGGLVAEQPDLCYKCHSNRIDNNIFRHGPVSAGLCTSCHHPHKSKTKNLLINEADESICNKCHDAEGISNNDIHRGNVEDNNCTECHDPHSSDLRFMMRKEICKKCHQITNEKFMHGPVASDYCSTCHSSHDSKKRFLLLAEGSNLCLTCHDATNVFDDALHRKKENKNCTNCHNPHGGKKKFMLIE